MAIDTNVLWSKLKDAANADRLGHALLLRHGQNPKSKNTFEKNLLDFCQSLQCESVISAEALTPCGKCQSCHLYKTSPSLEALVHPDFYFLKTEEDSLSYSVEQIRELSKNFSLRLALSSRRICIIRDAEYLSWTQSAPANALLKLLEEPRPQSLLILLSSRVESVLKTLQSRCQNFSFLEAAEGGSFEWASEWREFSDWLKTGAPKNLPANNPADAESFWKDRQVAFESLKEAFIKAFSDFRKNLSHLSLEESRRVLGFLLSWQDFLQNSRFHISGHLHWLELQLRLRSIS